MPPKPQLRGTQTICLPLPLRQHPSVSSELPLLTVTAMMLTPPPTLQVFKHDHEAATGRTSSIGQHNLCLDSHGAILNDTLFRNASCGEYIMRSSKVRVMVLAGGGRGGC